jgi:CheY-like chemotaxis protein
MSLRDIKFLVIEDHPFQRNMLRQMLIGMGAETVHSAEDGKEALRLLRDPAVLVDIIISDLAMPEMDGIELLAHLHAAREGVSLIFLSASQSSLRAAVEIAQDSGFQVLGAIAKPVSAENIAPLVALHLARRQGR